MSARGGFPGAGERASPPVPRPVPIPPRFGALALSAVLAVALVGCGEETPRPNVLLISIDTLRADHLFSYGHWNRTSPNLDALAERGVLFEHCFAPTAWTLPSHLSLLTGLDINVHGIDDERLWQVVGQPGGPAALPLRGTFASEVFQRAGYQTAGFVTWKYLEPRFGFGPGFDVYERVSDGAALGADAEAELQNLVREGNRSVASLMLDRPDLFATQSATSHLVVERAITWLDSIATAKKDDPWFLFCHFFDPHDDYAAPEPFHRMFTRPEYTGAVNGRGVASASHTIEAMSPADIEQLKGYYDGEIAWTDDRIGALLKDIERRGVRENTLVVVTSDHGEEFYEHGLRQHRAQLYRESVHVPLIVAWPAGLPAGLRVPGLVGLVDIAPTLYDLVDLRSPPHLSGVSLAGPARGAGPVGVQSYLGILQSFPRREWTPHRLVSLRRGQHSAIWHLPRDAERRVEYFDREDNPREVGYGRELFPGDPLLADLDAEFDRMRVKLTADRDSLPLRDFDARAIDAREIAEIAAMGYAGLDAAPAGDGVKAANTSRLVMDGGVWPDWP